MYRGALGVPRVETARLLPSRLNRQEREMTARERPLPQVRPAAPVLAKTAAWAQGPELRHRIRSSRAKHTLRWAPEFAI